MGDRGRFRDGHPPQVFPTQRKHTRAEAPVLNEYSMAPPGSHAVGRELKPGDRIRHPIVVT
jgi:hypothetical protein